VGVIGTSAALGACLLVLAVAVVLDHRPYRPGKRNYVPIMIVAVAGILVLGRHLLSLIVATWIEAGTRELAAPSVKQRLAAIRHLFDWLVSGRVVSVNPAGSVRGPDTSCRPGKHRCSILRRRARCLTTSTRRPSSFCVIAP
jgi:hypothetical protein